MAIFPLAGKQIEVKVAPHFVRLCIGHLVELDGFVPDVAVLNLKICARGSVERVRDTDGVAFSLLLWSVQGT